LSFGSPYVTLPEFTYHRPKSLEEALGLLKEHGEDAKVMGGGVGLLAFMKERLMSPTHVIDIKDVEELRQVRPTEKGLRVGAAATIAELLESGVLREDFAALHEALSQVADPMIRRRATLVGNLCEAIPWVDSPPALISLEASVEIVGREGRRSVPVSNFIRGPVDIDLSPREIVSAVEIPKKRRARSTFEKFTAGSEFSVASVAVALWEEGGRRVARVVYGAVNSTPIQSQEVEQAIQGGVTPASVRKAADVASEKVECVSDVLASSEYRKHLVKVIILKALGRLLQK
jgi:carbon-monoxide dehydrogenase medium subunit